MWLINYLFCLAQGHALSAFAYKGKEYKYCVRCGKFESTGVFKWNSSIQDSSQYPNREVTGCCKGLQRF